MSWTPENSAIRVTPEMEEGLKTAGHEEIKAIMAQAAIDQRLVVPDAYDASVLIPTALASTAPKGFAKAIIINGTKHIVEAESELALEKAVGELYRSQLQPAATEQQQTEQARGTDGRFVSQEDADAQAAHVAEVATLRMQMVRGEITPEEFLTRSGAFDEYLNSRGVDMETLQEASNSRYETSWADATQDFISRNPSWPGGEANKDLLGQLIVENHLENGDPAEVLDAVYKFAVENNLLQANPEIDLQNRIAGANSFSDIIDIMRPGSSSSLFNGR